MHFEFDSAKEIINQAKHGLSLSDAGKFDFESAIIREDVRHPYPEPRFSATGWIGERICVMIFVYAASPFG